MNSGVEWDLAPLPQARPRGAQAGQPPPPPRAAAPARSGAGRAFADLPGPGRGAGAGPCGAATRGPRARPTWDRAERRCRFERPRRAFLPHGSRWWSAPPRSRAPRRSPQDVLQAPPGAGEAAWRRPLRSHPGAHERAIYLDRAWSVNGRREEKIREGQVGRLRKGINILISTPGRLVDHIKSTKNMHFCRIRWLILDEADRILDLGFEKDIALILNAVNAERPERQNVLLSATLTEGVTRLADISLHEPVRISVLEGSQDQMHPKSRATLGASPPAASSEPDGFAIPVGLEQHVVLVPSKLRLVSLAAFILQKCKFEPDQKVIVFFSSCELVEFHHSLFLQTLLGGSGALAPGRLPSASPPLTFLRLHGDMEQEERTAVFQEFSRSKAGVLLCTDVAARGLDLPQVTWIVQYTAPSSPAEYIHRIGRTARIGFQGSSLLILAPSEAEYVNSLASHKINVSEMKMEDILSVLTRDDCFKGRRWGSQKCRAAGPQEIRERATVLQTVFEDYVHSSERTVSWAKKALQSFVRAYATYPRELKHIFHVRSLHLGHVAKSFGLRDAPKNLSTSALKKKKAHLRRPDPRRKTQSKHRLAELLRSEYSSGMGASGAKVKRPNKRAGPGSAACAQRPALAVGQK
ncbi:probable ATP-dependent RNA helicase DDX31 isoform X4 [Phacochoerus africanus]|uniref:probable ATP-dependent RNA helicase DDX31 isoform X4 n=1 Tax=Phacochoerus africanus TaxID=41426 RepID=UPI001FD88405|nr:probable ATP-dependent RNA helicase DDX31 isoform X4 [Phacochoerus africanus]